MTDKSERDGTSNADLMMAMVAGLPSEYLQRAVLVAQRRERREQRLKVLQAREMEEADALVAEAEARAASHRHSAAPHA